MDIISRLREYGIEPMVCDPCAEAGEAESSYGLKLSGTAELKDMDCLIFAVAHKAYRALDLETLKKYYSSATAPVLIDVKGIFNQREAEADGFVYWEM